MNQEQQIGRNMREFWARGFMREVLASRPSTFTKFERKVVDLAVNTNSPRGGMTNWQIACRLGIADRPDMVDRALDNAWRKAVRLVNDHDMKVHSRGHA